MPFILMHCSGPLPSAHAKRICRLNLLLKACKQLLLQISLNHAHAAGDTQCCIVHHHDDAIQMSQGAPSDAMQFSSNNLCFAQALKRKAWQVASRMTVAG
jgi:hypothetical protein